MNSPGLGSQPILQLTVRDPGPPAPVAAGKLFLPFARGTDAASRTSAGTGLELAIAARLAELMHGQIGQGAVLPQENEPSSGRELWVSLPLPAAEPGAQAAAGTAKPISPVSGRTSRRALVLLVEDIAVNQVVTATQLRREGHRVDVADDGAAAIRLAVSTPYDIVLMDLMMPGMSGFEAARHIRALPGPAGRTPIVALTANNSPEDRARCTAAGMMEMLSKPVRPAELSAALARALDRNDTVVPPAAPAAPTSKPHDDRDLLGLDRLIELRESLSEQLFATLAEQCLTEMDEMLQVLRDALADGQPAPVNAAAHALAGMAGGYGLTAVESRMRKIMAAAHAHNLDAAHAAASDMDAEARRSAAALRAILAPRCAA